jgi:hypothetical protein
MKRVQILGLFIGALLLAGYEPAAEAMPASASGIAAGFFESDGLVVKTKTTRRTYTKEPAYPPSGSYAPCPGYPYAPGNYGRPECGFYGLWPYYSYYSAPPRSGYQRQVR